jgi:hypothetical protein
MSENADFIAKLQQIEQLANALSAELDTHHAKTRAQHISILARSLRGRLELGSATVMQSGVSSLEKTRPGEGGDPV